MYEEIGSATIRLFQIYLSFSFRYPIFNYFFKGIIMKLFIDYFLEFLDKVVKKTPNKYDDLALEVIKLGLTNLSFYK